MCPACIASAAIFAAKVASIGGVAAVAVERLRQRLKAGLDAPNPGDVR
jgi:hypothetical protein